MNPTYLMYVERYRDLFIETKNPLYAWKAFENAKRMSYPIPEEILNYILTTAHSIVTLAQDPPKPKDRPVALAKALKLHKAGAGQGSAFTGYSTRLQDRKLALDVIASEFYEPDMFDYAFDDVSKKHGISKATVRRNFIKHEKQWRTIAMRLIESGAVKYGQDGRPAIESCGTADDHREAAAILNEIERINHGF